LMCTVPHAPGATKFLLNWPTTNVNITSPSGAPFLAWVRMTIKNCSDRIPPHDNLNQVQHQFLLQQWREIEKMLVEKGEQDTGIAALD
jgi:hypothetical protein